MSSCKLHALQARNVVRELLALPTQTDRLEHLQVLKNTARKRLRRNFACGVGELSFADYHLLDGMLLCHIGSAELTLLSAVDADRGPLAAAPLLLEHLTLFFEAYTRLDLPHLKAA